MNSTDNDSEFPVEEDTISSQLVHGLNFSPLEQGFDVGTLTGSPTRNELEEIVRAGHVPHPNQFPCYVAGRRFPTSIFNVKKQNGETSRRSWIVLALPNKPFIVFLVDCFHIQSIAQHIYSHHLPLTMDGELTKSGRNYGIEYLIMRKAMLIRIAICAGVNFKDALKMTLV